MVYNYIPLDNNMEDLSQDMNAWREKQSKRDKLSNEMGQYLLRGYRMLDLCCEECNVSIEVVQKEVYKYLCAGG